MQRLCWHRGRGNVIQSVLCPWPGPRAGATRTGVQLKWERLPQMTASAYPAPAPLVPLCGDFHPGLSSLCAVWAGLASSAFTCETGVECSLPRLETSMVSMDMTWGISFFFNWQKGLVDMFYVFPTKLPANHGGESLLQSGECTNWPFCTLVYYKQHGLASLWQKKKIYLNYILASGRTPLGKNLTRGV